MEKPGQDNVWNLFNINNKETRKTLMMPLSLLLNHHWTDFTICSNDPGQLNVSWVKEFSTTSQPSYNLFFFSFLKGVWKSNKKKKTCSPFWRRWDWKVCPVVSHNFKVNNKNIKLAWCSKFTIKALILLSSLYLNRVSISI